MVKIAINTVMHWSVTVYSNSKYVSAEFLSFFSSKCSNSLLLSTDFARLR